ncbi:MAG: Uma2 family endonuclease [Acidimicrobiales bacterium]
MVLEQAPARHAFSVEEWRRMAEAGLFQGDSHVELLDGEVFQMAAMGHPHYACVLRLNHLLVNAVGDRALVSVQCPVQLDDYSEPEPDLALVKHGLDSPDGHIAMASDVFLIIEVADSTLNWDVNYKAPRYARAGVPQLWVVDVTAMEVRVFADPRPDGYATTRRARRSDTLVVETLPGVALNVDVLLGPA